jgi:hypothetical protein
MSLNDSGGGKTFAQQAAFEFTQPAESASFERNPKPVRRPVEEIASEALQAVRQMSGQYADTGTSSNSDNRPGETPYPFVS